MSRMILPTPGIDVYPQEAYDAGCRAQCEEIDHYEDPAGDIWWYRAAATKQAGDWEFDRFEWVAEYCSGSEPTSGHSDRNPEPPEDASPDSSEILQFTIYLSDEELYECRKVTNLRAVYKRKTPPPVVHTDLLVASSERPAEGVLCFDPVTNLLVADF